MNAKPYELTDAEVLAAEGVSLAEMQVVMLEQLHLDLTEHAYRLLDYTHSRIHSGDWPEAMAISGQAIDLAAKVKAMLDEIRPLVEGAAGREALAARTRSQQPTH